MINLLSKSPKGLMRNESGNLDNLIKKIDFVLSEQRHQRSDLQDIKRMINKLLIDEHLQQQVDEYFDEAEESNARVDAAAAELPPELEDK